MWLIILPCPTGRVSVCDCSWLGISEGTSSRYLPSSLPKPTTDPNNPPTTSLLYRFPTTDSCLESGKQPDISSVYSLFLPFGYLLEPCPAPHCPPWQHGKVVGTNTMNRGYSIFLFRISQPCVWDVYQVCYSDSYMIPWRYVVTNLTCKCLPIPPSC